MLALVTGCATLQEAAALRRVQFRYDSVSDAEVAGVRIDRLRSFQNLSVTEAARLGLAVASKDVPLELTVNLQGRNPEENRVTARLLALDWAYWVDGRELIDGRIERGLQFPPGEAVDVPVPIRFNLYRFFEGDARTIFETALVLSGHEHETRDVEIRIVPTIDTSLGPIRYPSPITIPISSESP